MGLLGVLLNSLHFLKEHLKGETEIDERMLVGSSSQSIGAVAEKALSLTRKELRRGEKERDERLSEEGMWLETRNRIR